MSPSKPAQRFDQSSLAPELALLLRTGPFHEALRAAITVRGLALNRIQQRLAEHRVHVGVATLSYWQSGQRRPERPESIRAVRILETVLELPPTSLTALLRGAAPGIADQPPGTQSFSQLHTAAATIKRLFTSLDTQGDGKAHLISVHDEYAVNPGRDGSRTRTLEVLRAHQDLDSIAFLYFAEPGTAEKQITIHALQQCRLGRVAYDQPTGILATELLVDRRLRVGDTHILEYEITDTSKVDCTEYRRGFRFPAHQYTLQIAFPQDALPIRCTRFTRDKDRAPDIAPTDATLDGHGSTHLVATGVRPGLHGIRWEWQ